MRAAPLPALHRPRLLPASAAGRWAIGLFVLAVVSFGVLTVALSVGPSDGARISGSWWRAILALLSGAGSAAAGVVGTYAILRRREQALLVFPTTALGLLVVAYVVGEALTVR